MEQSNFRICILLVGLFGTVSIIMSVSGNHWIKVGKRFEGLWKVCTGPEAGDCQDAEAAWLTYVRAFMLLGLSAQFLSILYYIAMTTRPKLFGSLCMSFFWGTASVALMIGLCLYTYYDAKNGEHGFRKNAGFRFHWCYFFGWIGVIVTIVTTVMTCVDARRPQSPYAMAQRIE